jgi:hypothetical protein
MVIRDGVLRYVTTLGLSSSGEGQISELSFQGQEQDYLQHCLTPSQPNITMAEETETQTSVRFSLVNGIAFR